MAILPKSPFNPEMLILARNSRGFSQTELAKLVGVTQSKISKLEDGLPPPPSPEFLTSLSLSLNYPASFFFQTGGSHALSASFYRKKSALPAKLLTQCDARMNIQRIHIERLVKAVEFEPRKLPHLDPAETDGGPQQIARQIRAYWQIPRGPIKNLTGYIEDAGCFVVLFDFGTRQLDGLSLFADDGTPIIFLNKNLPTDRLRFTLAHELGHIIMHRIPSPTMEEEAHAFASELLMPEAEIRSSFYPLNFDQLARLKLYWMVSMGSLLKKAEDIGATSERYSRYMWMQMGKLGYRSKEPHSDSLPTETPGLLKELIEVYFSELNYTHEELAKTLSLTLDEYDQMYLGKPPSIRLLS